MTEQREPPEPVKKEFDEWLNRYMNAWSAELEIEMHAEETRETNKAKE